MAAESRNPLDLPGRLPGTRFPDIHGQVRKRQNIRFGSIAGMGNRIFRENLMTALEKGSQLRGTP